MTCPSCGESTIETPNGLHLNPKRGRMGRVGRDGVELSPDDIRNASVAGYYPHYCLPTSTTKNAPTNQSTLF